MARTIVKIDPHGKKMRDDWNLIKDELESRAADPAIDGRTRAAYARIDRRQYWVLVERLTKDGELRSDSKYFSEAVELWQRFKSGRREPDENSLTRMAKFRDRLTRGKRP